MERAARAAGSCDGAPTAPSGWHQGYGAEPSFFRLRRSYISPALALVGLGG